MNIKDLPKFKLPISPGVYFFLRGSKLLYIGKATSLKDRVKSYFVRDLIGTRGPLIVDMAFKATDLKFQKCDSVLEALILEANLIKKHQPYYNTKEKSDKSFNYIVITKEKLPKVIIVRGKNLGNFEKSSIFGPYTNSVQLKEALKIIRRIFPFLDDKSKNYLEFYKQINLVPDLEDRKLYLQNIKNIKLFFAGKKKQILINLKKEMKAYSKLREFEKAGEIKRQMFSLQHINDVALLKLEPSAYSLAPAFRIEAYDVAHMSGKNMVGVMTVVDLPAGRQGMGEVTKHEYKKFKIRTQADANDTGALKEVLERRLAHTEWAYPSLIVVDGGVAQLNVAKSILKNLKLKIPLVSVLKDERHKPKAIMGDESIAVKYKREILLGNSEAHRFAINYHKQMRGENFLK
jgi:excinuclease UvrABC nuclease subunit